MFCPQCGIKVELNDQKFCHSCGFELSKVGKSQPTELKKMIDFALKDHPRKPIAKSDGDSLNVNEPPKQVHIESKKEAQQSNNLQIADSAVPPSTRSWRSLYSPLSSAKKWKWGTGWIIIVYLFFSSQESKTFESFGTAGLLVQLIGCILSLVLYFYLRQRVFLRIEKTWLRSLFAGLITYAFVWLVALLSVLFLKSNDEKLSEFIETEVQNLNLYLQDFTKKDQELWAQYESEPTTNQHLRQNISLLQTAIPLYRHKDSLTVATLQKIYLAMLKTPSKEPSAGSYQIQGLQSKAQSMADAAQEMLTSLLKYHNALLSSDTDADTYLQSFQVAYARFETAKQEYGVLYKQYFGREVSRSYEEYKQKYNR